jgi:ferredoxin
MAYLITEECINCSACFFECPQNAILRGGSEWIKEGTKEKPLSTDHYFIIPEKCDDCTGIEENGLCSIICPMDCVEKFKY